MIRKRIIPKKMVKKKEESEDEEDDDEEEEDEEEDEEKTITYFLIFEFYLEFYFIIGLRVQDLGLGFDAMTLLLEYYSILATFFHS